MYSGTGARLLAEGITSPSVPLCMQNSNISYDAGSRILGELLVPIYMHSGATSFRFQCILADGACLASSRGIKGGTLTFCSVCQLELLVPLRILRTSPHVDAYGVVEYVRAW